MVDHVAEDKTTFGLPEYHDASFSERSHSLLKFGVKITSQMKNFTREEIVKELIDLASHNDIT